MTVALHHLIQMYCVQGIERKPQHGDANVCVSALWTLIVSVREKDAFAMDSVDGAAYDLVSSIVYICMIKYPQGYSLSASFDGTKSS